MWWDSTHLGNYMYKVTVNHKVWLDTSLLTCIDNLFASLAGGRTFSKLDPIQAYLQVPLEEDSKETPTRASRAIIIYPLEYHQRSHFPMNNGRNSVWHSSCVCLLGWPTSDRQVRSKTLNEELTRLESAGLRHKCAKCTFLLLSGENLGHSISAEGVRPTEKVHAVADAPAQRMCLSYGPSWGWLIFTRYFKHPSTPL